MKSALEIELIKISRSIFRATSVHDRAVVIGLILSATPFPPSNLVGLVIDLFNLFLITRGSLGRNELLLVIVSICLASLNLIIFLSLFAEVEPEFLGLWRHIFNIIRGSISVFLHLGPVMRSTAMTSLKKI